MGCTSSRSASQAVVAVPETNNNDGHFPLLEDLSWLSAHTHPQPPDHTRAPRVIYPPGHTSSLRRNTEKAHRPPSPPSTSIVLAESACTITKLAVLLDPDRSSVREILSGLTHPTTETPLMYWPCPDCTYHNKTDSDECEVCGRARIKGTDSNIVANVSSVGGKGKEEEKYEDVTLDSALATVECPVCLEVLTSPVTLPCGHSVCSQHTPELRNRCPICRQEFVQEEGGKDAALARNVTAVVKLANLVDPERDTVRDATKALAEEGVDDMPPPPSMRSIDEIARELMGVWDDIRPTGGFGRA